jgi:hypothetical protein
MPTPAQFALEEHAHVIRTLGRRVLGDVIEIGRRLTAAKKICGHGNWLEWLDREFGWSDRHALNFMRLYQLSRKSENFSDLEIPISGLCLLAAPSTPVEVVDVVIERAAGGERVSLAEIQRSIYEAKKPEGEPRERNYFAPVERTLDMLEAEQHLEHADPRSASSDPIDRAVMTVRATALAALRGLPRERWRELLAALDDEVFDISRAYGMSLAPRSR